MPKPTKPPIPQFRSWDEVDGAGVELLKLDGRIVAAAAALAATVAAAKEKHKASIQQPTVERDLLLSGIEKFVTSHRADLDGQSRVLTHVVVGFRKRPPSVAKLLDTWDAVKARLESLGARAKAFLAVKTDVDKNAIKKAWSEGKLSTDQLSELGVGIDNTSEDFYCEALAVPVASLN